MKKIISLILISQLCLFSFAQDPEVKKMVSEGIVLHDKGEYAAAIKKYDEALTINNKDYYANYEKSLSCYMLKRYEDCISISKYLLDAYPDNSDNLLVYSNYGSSLDDIGQSAKAIEIYNKGIKRYPTHYILYFNRGLTFERLNRPEDALQSYQMALERKPLHPSANLYTGRILEGSNKVPALLASLSFLAIERNGDRAVQSLERIQRIMYGNISKDGDNKTTITINSALLDDKNKKKENNFSSVEMMMSLLFISTGDKKLEDADEGEKLSLKLQLLVSSLSNNKKDGKGFYWKFYVPFFIELKEQGYMSTLAHIVLISKDDGENNKWLEDNNDKVEAFNKWLTNYRWIL